MKEVPLTPAWRPNQPNLLLPQCELHRELFRKQAAAGG